MDIVTIHTKAKKLLQMQKRITFSIPIIIERDLKVEDVNDDEFNEEELDSEPESAQVVPLTTEEENKLQLIHNLMQSKYLIKNPSPFNDLKIEDI